METLPGHVAVQIFYFVPPLQLVDSLKLVCSDWHDLVTSQATWRNICVNRWGTRPELESSGDPEPPTHQMHPFAVNTDEEEKTLPYADVDALSYYWFRELHEATIAIINARSDTKVGSEITISNRNLALSGLLSLTEEFDFDIFGEYVDLFIRYALKASTTENSLRIQGFRFIAQLFEQDSLSLRKLVKVELIDRTVVHITRNLADALKCHTPSQEASPEVMEAVEALIQTCDTFGRQIAKRIPAIFAKDIFPVLLNGIKLVSEEDYDALERSPSTIPSCFAEALDRTALSIGGQAASTVAPQLVNLVETGDWQSRWSALRCLSIIAEACCKEMKALLPPLFHLLCKAVNYDHPMVRYAALNCIGQMATDLAPEFQEQLGEGFIGVLAEQLKQEKEPVVLAHCCAAIINLSENLPNRLAPLVIEKLVDSVLGLMAPETHHKVRLQAITAFAAISGINDVLIADHYPQAMAILKPALEENDTEIVSKTIECISILTRVVRKKVPDDEASMLRQIIAKASTMSQRSVKQYSLSAIARYLEAGNEDALRAEVLVDGFNLGMALIAGPDGTETDDTDEDLDVCLGVLRACFEKLNGDFPRSKLLTAWQEIIALAQSERPCQVVAFTCLVPLLNLLNRPRELEDELLEAIEEAVHEGDFRLVGGAVACLKPLVRRGEVKPMWREKYQEILRKAKLKILALASLSEEEMAEDEEIDDVLDECFEVFGTALAAVYATFQEEASALVDLLLTLDPLKLQGNCQNLALCQLLEFLEAAKASQAVNGRVAAQTLPVCITACVSTSPPLLLQAAGYGIGLIAKVSPNTFSAEAAQCLIALQKAHVAIASKEEYQHAADNVLSSLGKCLAAVPANALRQQHALTFIQRFVLWMPLQHDLAELPAAQAALSQLVLNHHDWEALFPLRENILGALSNAHGETDLRAHETVSAWPAVESPVPTHNSNTKKKKK